MKTITTTPWGIIVKMEIQPTGRDEVSTVAAIGNFTKDNSHSTCIRRRRGKAPRRRPRTRNRTTEDRQTSKNQTQSARAAKEKRRGEKKMRTWSRAATKKKRNINERKADQKLRIVNMTANH